MVRERRRRSLRGQMTFIILLCWLLPMALAAKECGMALSTFRYRAEIYEKAKLL